MARSMVSTSHTVRRGHFSPTVEQVCATDGEPTVKARKLRELAAWYRAFAAGSANPVIWESRLLTAEELDAEAGRIEPKRDS
jgi:hypothetical protein